MAYQYGGRWGTVKIASKTATDYDIGDMIAPDETNPILATTTSKTLLGICKSDKPSTDTSTDDIYLAVPKDRSATFVAVVTGTFTKACEGRSYDISDELTVTTAATTYKAVKCEKYINSTTGVFSINFPIS